MWSVKYQTTITKYISKLRVYDITNWNWGLVCEVCLIYKDECQNGKML